MIPKFEPNDEVIFEVRPDGEGPRWQLNVDKGYSDVHAKGIVTEVSDVAIILDAIFPDNEVRKVVFPNTKSSDYEPEQWWYPGYLRGEEDPGPNCDCGHGNNSPFHWIFCTRGAWLRDAI